MARMAWGVAASLALALPLLFGLPHPAAAAADGRRCPVRLLDIVPEEQAAEAGAGGAPEGLRLDEEGVQYLAELPAPLYVVPALGVYRGGKSLLLNRLMGRRAPYAEGFGVGHQQQTFTRGIDICAEHREGLGTIVWMDTEGLFSSEDARSAYGPKIFSLALLFSSSVLLNNVKVLSEQFFSFFGEQQQIARVLKQGLASSGLPGDALLPGNLSVFWVLQQPIRFEGDEGATRQQLDAFLALPGDEGRARVARDFRHTVREVPIATHDARQWGRLDAVPDEELLPEYVAAVDRLGEAIAAELRSSARPLRPEGVAAQLRLYVELVQQERYSGQLAKEAFEEAEIGQLCGHYGRAASALAGQLPATSLQEAFEGALKDLDAQRAAAAEAFHLGADWTRKLERCLRDKQDDLRQRNAEAVLQRWKSAAGAVAEEGGCFFLGGLTQLLKEYAATYGQTFSHSVQAQAVDYASALQRTRLVECVRLRDFLLPFAPWLAWPIFGFYLRDGVVSGLVSLALHVIVLAGLYAVMQFLHQLPPYLDVEYPVLRAHPILLDLTMRAPPMVPWAAMARVFAGVGAVRSAWKLSRFILNNRRAPGEGHYVGQMVNMELKLNTLLKRSEAMLKQELIANSLSASEHIETGNARAAARSLVRLLCLSREATDDWTMGVAVDARLRKRARAVLQHLRLPPPTARPPAACVAHKLEELVAKADWEALLEHGVALLEQLAAAQAPAQGGAGARTSPQQTTPLPNRTRRRGVAEEASPALSVSPHNLADASTEASTPEEGAVRSPGEPAPVLERRRLREEVEEENEEEDEEEGDEEDGDEDESGEEELEEDEEGEGADDCSDACTEEDAEDAQAEVRGATWLERCSGFLAILVGFGAVAAAFAWGDAVGMMPGASGA